MPVTAKLSRNFYDRLGEEIANELVEWFNQVDATYRGDLRDLNELNFARFDAKLEQRMTQFDVKLEQRIGALERRMDVFEARMEQRFAEFEARMERRFGEQARWMFAAWASLLIPIIGLWIRG
jgi:DNA anti-recombination protein RmuC